MFCLQLVLKFQRICIKKYIVMGYYFSHFQPTEFLKHDPAILMPVDLNIRPFTAAILKILGTNDISLHTV